jgi:hypothetical protein
MQSAKRQADNIRQLRAAILQLLYSNHQAMNSKFRLVELAGALNDLGFRFESLNQLASVMQDMSERDLVSFAEEKERFSRKVIIHSIAILPRGRDLVEGTIKDDAIDFV